jgi:hypothetical protein
MTEKTICTICGVTSVCWVEKKLGQAITIRRDYMPTTIVFRLKPETTSSFIVRPEIARMAVHIRSLDDGKLNYAVDLPLPEDIEWMRLFMTDSRIEAWHTVTLLCPDDTIKESALVCDSHVNFHGGRYISHVRV